MKSVLIVLILIMSSLAHGAVISTLSFQAEVSSFDKKWVQLKANNKKFNVPRVIWEKANGPVRTGTLKASLSPEDFKMMVAADAQ